MKIVMACLPDSPSDVQDLGSNLLVAHEFMHSSEFRIEAFVQDRNSEDPIYSTLYPSIPPNGGWHSKAKHLTLLSNHRINRRRNQPIP
jgi:hypothetical protein